MNTCTKCKKIKVKTL